MPERVQLRRTKGWRKPEGAVVVARPSKWGNPYRVEGDWVTEPDDGPEHYCAPGEARGVAVRLFRGALASCHLDITIVDVEDELRGRDLACWCPLEDSAGRRVPCHADVLLEIANRPITEPEENDD
jgi:hypothetical protein